MGFNTHPNDGQSTPHIVHYLATCGSQISGQLQDLFCWSSSAEAVQQLLTQLVDKPIHCNAWNAIVCTTPNTISADHVSHKTNPLQASEAGVYNSDKCPSHVRRGSRQSHMRSYAVKVNTALLDSQAIRVGRLQDDDVCRPHGKQDRRSDHNQSTPRSTTTCSHNERHAQARLSNCDFVPQLFGVINFPHATLMIGLVMELARRMLKCLIKEWRDPAFYRGLARLQYYLLALHIPKRLQIKTLLLAKGT